MRLLVIVGALLLAAVGLVQGYWLLLPLAALLAGAAFHRFEEEEARRDAVVRFFYFLESQDWASVLLLALVLTGVASWFGQEYLGSYIPGIVWLAAISLSVLAAVMYDRQYVDVSLRLSSTWRRMLAGFARWEWIAIGFITLLALALRVYHLNQLLPFIHGDEGEMGMRALQVLRGDIPEFNNEPMPLFATSFLNHPTLFYYMQAFAMWVGGESMVSLRVLSAIFGALCVPVVYMIGRIGWGWVAGFVAAWLLAVSHLHIQFSRIALNNIQSVWFGLLYILLLIVIYQIQRVAAVAPMKAESSGAEDERELSTITPLLPYTLLGLVVGLSQYMYYGSRLLPVIIVPVFVLLWYRGQISRHQFTFFALAACVAYLPMLFHFVSHPDAFSNRSSGVFVLNHDNLVNKFGESYIWWRDIPRLLLDQSQYVIRFLIDHGDVSSFYTAENAGLDPITAMLFWLGLGISVAAWRRIQEFTLIMWLGLGLLLAGILTGDPPNAPRMIVVVPVTFVFAGIFLQKLYDYFAVAKVDLKRSGLVILIALLVFSGYLNVSSYFVKFATIMGSLGPSTIGRELAQVKDESQVYLVAAPHLFVKYGVLRFLDRGVEMYDLENLSDLDSQLHQHPTSKKLLFIVMPYRSDDLTLLQERYPHGIAAEHRDPADRVLYTSFSVSSTQ